MKNKILLMAIAVGSIFGLSSCENFLDETPNKSGSAYIYHMDQLVDMTGAYNLYSTSYIWTDLLFAGDGIDISPELCKANGVDNGTDYQVWAWDYTELETGGMTGTSWTPCYKAIFTFNTVLENMDIVTQTTLAARKQVEGEALYGRAYFHFMLLVQYCLWDENELGIGYREGTLPGDIPTRETVKYTLDKIFADLNAAEAALTEAGRTSFEIERNFRPTVPTVKALRARIALYRGDYQTAYDNAAAFLQEYSVLEDFSKSPKYNRVDRGEFHLLKEGNTEIAKTVKTKYMPNIQGGQGMINAAEWVEFIMPHYSGLYYSNRTATPISKMTFDMFNDKDNDNRWEYFHNNFYMLDQADIGASVSINGVVTPNCISWENQQILEEWNYHIYDRFGSGSTSQPYVIGLTVPEMYLIKAECEARLKVGDAAATLRTLRKARFTTEAAANNIGGTLKDVLDERVREMTEIWRFYDIKRLNGADNANITISKRVVTDFTNPALPSEVRTLAPDSPKWAIPIPSSEILLMGWEQNRQ